MKTVLLIEDNLDVRETTMEILELAGFKVVAANNGKEGIIEAVNSKPDIILCDILMPELNGYEVIKQLKNNPETASIPFIYVTASGEKNEVKLAMAMGANGYIRKPFESSELVSAINQNIKN